MPPSRERGEWLNGGSSVEQPWFCSPAVDPDLSRPGVKKPLGTERPHKKLSERRKLENKAEQPRQRSRISEKLRPNVSFFCAAERKAVLARAASGGGVFCFFFQLLEKRRDKGYPEPQEP